MRNVNHQCGPHFGPQFEHYFCYHWNSARRRAHIFVSLLALLIALAVFAA
jgi:hypothetical protein